MNVLVITGDKTFKPGHPRYELQKSAVERLEVVYWGRGSMWPKLPTGPFDVVTVQDPFWRGLFGWYVAKRLGAKLNVQVHTPETLGAPGRFVIRRADSVRVVSERIKKLIAHPHTTVLPVYVDIERFRNIERHPEPNTILWIGRFEEEKDPLLALAISKEVGAKLIMLGTGSLLQKLQEQGGAELLGWQDIVPYLARATLVLSTSRHESWGASIIEALAAKVPVVAPDVGVAKEAGAIVVPREQLAETVKKILAHATPGRLLFEPLSKAVWQETFKRSLMQP